MAIWFSGDLGGLQEREREFVVLGPKQTPPKGTKLAYRCWPELLYSLAHPRTLLARQTVTTAYVDHHSQYPEVEPDSVACRAEQWWLRQGYGRVPPLASAAYEGMLRDYADRLQGGTDDD